MQWNSFTCKHMYMHTLKDETGNQMITQSVLTPRVLSRENLRMSFQEIDSEGNIPPMVKVL